MELIKQWSGLASLISAYQLLISGNCTNTRQDESQRLTCSRMHLQPANYIGSQAAPS